MIRLGHDPVRLYRKEIGHLVMVVVVVAAVAMETSVVVAVIDVHEVVTGLDVIDVELTVTSTNC